MRIAVLQLQEEVPLDGLGAHLETTTYQAAEGMPHVKDFDGIIILGGKMSVEDVEQFPWLTDIEQLIRDCIEVGKPVLGICLGGQLIAKACGGKVVVNHPNGPERGVKTLSLRPEAKSDPTLRTLYHKLGKEFLVPVMHSDAAVKLPPNSIWLASSEKYPLHAFRVGCALGLQFHPEATASLMREWLFDAGEDTAKCDRKYVVNRQEMADLGRAVATGFLSEVADSLE
ncbi:MAG: type 1 glutamine amidotransferase [Propionibacteriaceae bacterium]|jgi:GMP synthase (glutamine-hydrolysing)|nr:type 1 glutamine amidotransferase [Propionibacteriaceae bacterium]